MKRPQEKDYQRVIGGNYYETSTIRKYQEITKNKVMEIFGENPLLFIKNALLNSLQVFSIGYINKGGDIIKHSIRPDRVCGAVMAYLFKKICAHCLNCRPQYPVHRILSSYSGLYVWFLYFFSGWILLYFQGYPEQI